MGDALVHGGILKTRSRCAFACLRNRIPGRQRVRTKPGQNKAWGKAKKGWKREEMKMTSQTNDVRKS